MSSKDAADQRAAKAAVSHPSDKYGEARDSAAGGSPLPLHLKAVKSCQRGAEHIQRTEREILL